MVLSKEVLDYRAKSIIKPFLFLCVLLKALSLRQRADSVALRLFLAQGFCSNSFLRPQTFLEQAPVSNGTGTAREGSPGSPHLCRHWCHVALAAVGRDPRAAHLWRDWCHVALAAVGRDPLVRHLYAGTGATWHWQCSRGVPRAAASTRGANVSATRRGNTRVASA